MSIFQILEEEKIIGKQLKIVDFLELCAGGGWVTCTGQVDTCRCQMALIQGS